MLQSRHGHDSGFHRHDSGFHLMTFLKFSKESISFKCDGIARVTVFTFGIINCDLFLKLY